MNANLPPKASAMFPSMQIPGIDDCDHLFSASSRNGMDAIYIRIKEYEFDGRVFYYYQKTLDCESNHSCDDLGGIEGPFFNLKTLLFQAAEESREWFKGNEYANNYTWDTEWRKYLRNK